ncbi:uncharacterized protein BXZ73DRAFT_99671 [Epithele typhae]|uniref:uncharacterized protein n=1 Tax=Epithele typhae TaxID=378194 RepID=UPI002008C538|nr:uncharacterized protein BXZ73DRAFT_99671 [Epithele typhae]KAH9938996.1 hypothetical protein BXZ73DRAFT_99671 [Epithele typhae]
MASLPTTTQSPDLPIKPPTRSSTEPPTESPEAVAREILPLSTRGTRPISSISTNMAYEHAENANRVKVLGNISFMMSPGGPEDARTHVVGVIGRIDREGIHAVITSGNARREDIDGNQSSLSLIAASDQRGADLLDSWDQPFREFDDYDAYVVDATSVIQHFCAGVSDPTIHSWKAFMFIISRCYHKLLARLENGDKVWGGPNGTEHDHPASYIYRAYNEGPAPLVSEAYFELKLPPPLIQKTLIQRWGLEPSSSAPSSASHSPGNAAAAERRHFRVSNDNAPRWSQVVHDVVQDIRQFLHAMVTRQTPYEPKDYVTLYDSMSVLKVLLSAGVVAHLITANMGVRLSTSRDAGPKGLDLRSILEPIKDASKQLDKESDQLDINDIFSKLSQETNPDEPTDTEASDGDDTDDDDDCDSGLADARIERGETPTSHVIRHFKTLVAPLNTLNTLRRLRRAHSAAVKVYHYKGAALASTGSPAVFKDVLEAAQKIGLSVPKQSRFSEVLEHPENAKLNGALHAEAELLTLAWSVRAQPEAVKRLFSDAFPDLENISEGDAIPMGVCKKPCYCCFLLAQKLASTALTGNNAVKFILPGTHATVYPWVPPDGLPLAVLQSIRGDLKVVLTQAINEALRTTGSAQSSPFSDDSELYDLSDIATDDVLKQTAAEAEARRTRDLMGS